MINKTELLLVFQQIEFLKSYYDQSLNPCKWSGGRTSLLSIRLKSNL